MKKLSKKETLKECKKMWEWLACRPDKRKEDYFFLAKGMFPYNPEIPRHFCYTCEDARNWTGKIDCSLCLLLDLWIPGISPTTAVIMQINGNCPCEQPESPYAKWKVEEIGNRGKFAQQIADYCTLLLEKEKKHEDL